MTNSRPNSAAVQTRGGPARILAAASRACGSRGVRMLADMLSGVSRAEACACLIICLRAPQSRCVVSAGRAVCTANQQSGARGVCRLSELPCEDNHREHVLWRGSRTTGRPRIRKMLSKAAILGTAWRGHTIGKRQVELRGVADPALARLLDEANLGADLAADDVDVREVRTSRRRRPDAAYGELSSAPAAPSTGGLTSHILSFDNTNRSRQPIPRPYRFAGRSKLAMIMKDRKSNCACSCAKLHELCMWACTSERDIC